MSVVCFIAILGKYLPSFRYELKTFQIYDEIKIKKKTDLRKTKLYMLTPKYGFFFIFVLAKLVRVSYWPHKGNLFSSFIRFVFKG